MFQLLLCETHKRLNGTVTADVKLGLAALTNIANHIM